MQLLSTALLFFVSAVFLYPFRTVLEPMCYISAVTSLLLLLLRVLEAGTIDDDTKATDKAVAFYTKRIREIKAKLNLA